MVGQGEADLAPKVTKEQCDAAPKCESTPTVETVILRIDTKNPTLADLRVREAISMAFNKQQIMDDIMGGGKIVGQIVGPSAVGYADLPPYPYDPEKAKALIAAAKADGVDVGIPIEVTAREAYPTRSNEIVQLIANSLKAIGMTGATSETKESARSNSSGTIGYNNIPPDRAMLGLMQHGQELMDYSGSVVSYYDCSGQTSAYCDPQLEKMLRRRERQDRCRCAQTALAAIAKYVYDQVPVVPIGLAQLQLRAVRPTQLEAPYRRIHPPEGDDAQQLIGAGCRRIRVRHPDTGSGSADHLPTTCRRDPERRRNARSVPPQTDAVLVGGAARGPRRRLDPGQPDRRPGPAHPAPVGEPSALSGHPDLSGSRRSHVGEVLAFVLGLDTRRFRNLDLAEGARASAGVGPGARDTAADPWPFIIAVPIALALGVLSALRPDGCLDRVLTAVSLAGVSIADFWLGLMLILFFGVQLHLLPTSGYGGVEYACCPRSRWRFGPSAGWPRWRGRRSSRRCRSPTSWHCGRRGCPKGASCAGTR